jgi:hypothetical protein
MYRINHHGLFTGLFSSILLGASAQVTIDGSNLYPIGANFTLAEQLEPAAGPGAPGQDMLWTFTGLQAETLTERAIYAPSMSPLPVLLEGDRVVVDQMLGVATHFSLLEDWIIEHGEVAFIGDEPLVRHLQPIFIRLQFPAEFGQMYGGVSGSVFKMAVDFDPGEGMADSIRIRSHIDYLHEIDGWGEVIMPNGPFPALRQNSFIMTTDTVDLHIPAMGGWVEGFDVSVTTERTYTYWSPSVGLPLVRFTDMDDDGTIDQAEWVHQVLTTSLNDEPLLASTMRIFPNPAHDQVTVVMEETGGINYRLVDMKGSEVLQGRSASERLVIPLEHVDSGVYMLEIQQNGTIQHQRLIVE